MGLLNIVVVLFLACSVKGDEFIRNVVEVNTPSGWVRGYEERVEDNQVFRFVQIPFAQPPVGELRFQKPQPIEKWEGVQGTSDDQATGCSQWYFPMPGADEMKLDEDCLFLNIYVPGRISVDRNLSVMVWIHGGGFIYGAGTQYNPVKLVSKGDVIVVTINYRLGLLGFFTMNDPLVSGNYGLWDQIEALRWIQNNIAAFGGNPKSVTIFGESAGATAVNILTLIPSNKGLFQRAVSQSAMVLNQAITTRELEKKTVDLLLERTDCKGKEDATRTLKCLQELPVENITNAITITDMLVPLNMSFEAGGFLPSIDGELIKENFGYPKSFDDELYGFLRSIDFMSGTTDGEGNVMLQSITPEIQELYNFNVTEKIPIRLLCEMTAPVYVDNVVGNVPELSQEICDFYTTTEGTDAQSQQIIEFHNDNFFIIPSNNLLTIHAKENTKANTFQYLWTKKSPVQLFGEPPSWFKGAFHGDELAFLFDISRIMPIPEDQLESLKKENELSETVIRYWTNFAKSGNPGGETVPEWPPYDVNSKTYVIIDNPIKTGENFKAEATEFLNKIIDFGRRRLYHDEL